MMLRQFHNNLRILIGIDRFEIERELGRPMTDDDWGRFQDCPFNWFIRATEARAEAIWRVIQARQPKAK